MWFKNLGLFWKVVLGFIGVIFIGLVVIASLFGVVDSTTETEGERVERITEESADDWGDVSDKLEGLNEQERADALSTLEFTASMNLQNDEVGTILENYSYDMFSTKEELVDGLYVFYNRDSPYAEKILERLTDYKDSEMAYPVIIYHMNIDASAIAGTSVIIGALGREDVLASGKFPVAMFIRYGKVMNVFELGDTLEDLPKNYN